MFQDEQDLEYLQAFDKAISDGFLDGRPLHVSDPTKFESKSVEEIQAIF